MLAFRGEPWYIRANRLLRCYMLKTWLKHKRRRAAITDPDSHVVRRGQALKRDSRISNLHLRDDRVSSIKLGSACTLRSKSAGGRLDPSAGNIRQLNNDRGE